MPAESEVRRAGNNGIYLRLALERGWISQEQAKAVMQRCKQMWCGEAMVNHKLLTAEQDEELLEQVRRFLHPQDIEGYLLSAELGRGGMGVVYKALQMSLERTVAIKVLLPRFALSPHFRQRFLVEARAVGRVNHQNVISCYDVAEDRGLIFMVMELMTGGDLKARVRNSS